MLVVSKKSRMIPTNFVQHYKLFTYQVKYKGLTNKVLAFNVFNQSMTTLWDAGVTHGSVALLSSLSVVQ